MDAYKSGVESVGNEGGVVAADLCAFFDYFGFHVAISDCCAGWGWANVVLPLCAEQEAARNGGHHCARVYDGVGVVG